MPPYDFRLLHCSYGNRQPPSAISVHATRESVVTIVTVVTNAGRVGLA